MPNDLNRREFVVAGGLVTGLAQGAPKEKLDTRSILNYNQKMEYRRLGKTGIQLSEISLGGLVSVEAVLHYGIIAPAGTPQQIVAKLNAALHEALADPALSSRFAAEGAEPLATTPEEYAADIDREETKWAALVKASGAKAE